MSGGNSLDSEPARREQREAQYVAARLKELYEAPLSGKFDAKHLKAVHAYIFQDLPEHKPGVIRERTELAWIKDRVLEGVRGGHVVFYAHEAIETKITEALNKFGGVNTIKGKTPEFVAERLALLYGDLDYAHGFYEGNSRTLREFTRELASAAGYNLDWIKTAITAKERNELYVARDVAAFERAFPGLNEERAMQTNDRAEYEAWFDLRRLRGLMGNRSLETIIGEGLSRQISLERGQDIAKEKGWER